MRLGRLLSVFGACLILTFPVTAGEPQKRAIDDPTRALLKTFRDEFIAITPGKGDFPAKFTMGRAEGGADAERPVREVVFGYNFSIAKYEVPQNLWEAVMGSNPSKWKGPRNSVEMFSFDDAVVFCIKVTALLRAANLVEPNQHVRLPSEAEWEYCARAGTATVYSFGDDVKELDAYGWHTGNAAGNDPPVGAKKPNNWKLYDVHGYLWEFCADRWHDDYKGAPTNGSAWTKSGDEKKRVIRGGSWKDKAGALTSSHRVGVSVKTKDDAIGLRCVLASVGKRDKRQTRADDEGLFVAEAVTKSNEFTGGIEGPACDADGNIFAVNYEKQSTIGRVTPAGKGEVFVELPGDSVGNGIRFDRAGLMYVADYVNHNVLRIDLMSREVSVFAHHDDMNQPNDLAIGPDGVLYASDPNWGKKTGQLWRIDRKGQITQLAADMGTTNGIEVSPDGHSLYVNESVQRNIWAFTIAKDGKLADKRLLKKFADHGFDGMRCDVDGNLYVTRYGKGTVVKLSPDGKVLREIAVLGARPSNICFGGPDGRTAYVTEVEHRRLVSFRVDRPGLAWQRWREK